ncbi:MAG: hypothetical protein WHT06_04520 [Desulfobacterales bacterium]
MEFYLHYDGPLKANGNIRDKHHLREQFHAQLSVLWGQVPLAPDIGGLLSYPPAKNSLSVIMKRSEFTFAPLVCEKLALVCELDITFLRPEAPGAVITQGGDIDNRLKTLFDGLRIPRVPDEIPSGFAPIENDKPFFCLLEDDNLITRVNVATGRLLRENAGQNEVVLLIKITTKAVKAIWANLGLG